MRVGWSESRYLTRGYSGDAEKEEALRKEVPKVLELKL